MTVGFIVTDIEILLMINLQSNTLIGILFIF